ncbi:MAG: GIY-YIG nuclease family protein [Chloroflexi bacterium]|nr:MAG: GIY-YIG nuclease family protein [Chloroflexota bacterium]
MDRSGGANIEENVPTVPGSYALLLELKEPVRLAVGRLGEFLFPRGDYLYLGSAHGPGGLRARLRHHAWPVEHPHWHLDWLRPWAALPGGWYATGTDLLECAWSQALLCLPGICIPAPGFGSADCRRKCPAHLIAFPGGVNVDLVEEVLRRVPGTPLIGRFLRA